MSDKSPSPLEAGIHSFIDLMGKATVWIGLTMIALVAINVLLRYSFSFGSVWAQELEWHLLAALILLGMSYALQRGDNVRVDLFYANFSPAKKFIVDVVSVLLLLAISLYFIKLSLAYVGQSYSILEASPDPGGIPYRWVVKALIPLGYGLIALQCVGELLRLFRQRKAGESSHV
ncbi:MAG: TRAP transporter small permease subunit [Hylemonella sp.]|uniref:TRAP transporter small permease subunit n=1 Tax=Hylemonella sp. TaxID=2066020 RepID=UPI0022C9D723|nr:TRAP transporter small permease subunit [Hylemonella sp.]MCZ8252709.1 TRAP transporter small permease subunit [Hylemonella sp.]